MGYLITINNKKTKINELLKFIGKAKKVKKFFYWSFIKQIIKVELGKQENSAIEVGLRKNSKNAIVLKILKQELKEYSKDEKGLKLYWSKCKKKNLKRIVEGKDNKLKYR